MKKLVLTGHVPSKKNLYRRGRNGRMYLNSEVKAAIDWLIIQASSKWRGQPLEHPDIAVTFRVRDRRSDRDNKLATVMDVLQKAGVLKNDNTKRSNGTLTVLPAEICKDEGVVIEITPRKEGVK